MVKGSILQEHITILYQIYLATCGQSMWGKKIMELQREIDKSTIIIADFYNPLSEMDRSWRQKISKDIVKLIMPSTNWI